MENIFVKEEPNNHEECEKPILWPLEVTVKQEIYEDLVDNQKPVNICDILKSVNSDNYIFKSEIEVEEPVIFAPVYTEIPYSSKDVNNTIDEIYHCPLCPIKFYKKELLNKHVHLHISTDEEHVLEPKTTSSKLGTAGGSSEELKDIKEKNFGAKQSKEARRSEQQRRYAAKRRALESKEARKARLQEKRQYRAKKRASESEQAREARLQQKRQDWSKMLALESEEAREARLQKRRQYTAERLASESEQAKKARLQYHRQYVAKKLALESEEVKEARLQQRRLYKAEKRALESDEAREARLQQRRLHRAKKRPTDTKEGTKTCLQQLH